MSRRRWRQAAPVALFVALTSAAMASARSPAASLPPELMAQLWVEPADLESRDLYWGPGGEAQAPGSDADYRFKKLDRTGHSPGYKVEDPSGRQWKVKVGDEAQAEIVASRILWAIGYHQPALYYLPRWRLSGGPTSAPPPGRFRLESDHEKSGSWAWQRNPFVGTRQLHGLLVANLVLNNWDLDTDNNRLYRPKLARDRAAKWYVVQDVGGSLGKSSFPIGSRNKVEDFESQDLVRGVDHGRVKFDYRAYHFDLVSEITPADVVWVCRLLARLSDHQLAEAFRAAQYPDDIAARYVRKIRQKIEQGLALAAADGSSQ